MTLAQRFRPAALAFSLLTLVPALHAQERAVLVETVTQTPFMTGGIGKDQQEVMRRAGRDFSLRLEFSERRDNEFVVGADVLISDLRGNPVFILPYAGPIVNVALPEGEYRVTASFQGETINRLVSIRGKSGQDVYFHWKGRPKSDVKDTVSTN